MTMKTRLGLILGVLLGAAIGWVPAQAQNTGGTSTANANASLTTTTCPGTGCVTLPVRGLGSVSIQLTGTWSGTITFKGSIGGVTFTTLNMTAINGASPATSTTANGIFTGSVVGLTHVRAEFTTATSGTAVVQMLAVSGGGASGSASLDLSGSSFSGNDAASATGAAVPAKADYIGVNNGGTLVGVLQGQQTMANSLPVTLASNQGALAISATDLDVQSGGADILSTTAFNAALGTAGTADTQVLSVQGIASMTPILATVTATDLDVQSGGADILSTTAFNASLGTAGTADTQVQTVQGIASMTPLLVTLSGTNTVVLTAETTKVIGTVRLADGSGDLLESNANGGTQALAVVVYDASGNAITAFSGSGGTASNFTSTFPSSGTAAGFSDGTNMQGARVVDLDTGAGAVYGLITNLVKRTSGGPTELIGQAAMAASLPVTIASDQSAIPSSQSGTWNITNVSGTVSLPTGAATAAKQPALGTAGTASTDVITVQGIASMTPLLATLSGTNNIATVTAVTSITNPVAATQSGTWNIATLTTLTSITNAVSVNPGTATLWAVYVEDAPETAGGNLMMTGVVRRDTAAASATTTGDNTTLNVDSLGRLWITSAVVEDAPETAAGQLLGIGTVRRDTAASSAGTTGDNATLNTDAVGALWTNPFSQTQAAGTYLTVRLSDGSSFLTPSVDYTHDGALTIGTTAGPMTVGRGSAAAPTNVGATDDAVAAWFLLNGSQVVNLAAGGTLITATSSSLNVACTTGCTSTTFVDDAGFTVGTTPIIPIGGLFDTQGDTVNEDDGGAIRMSANRNMFINIRDAAGNERGVNVNASNEALVTATQSGTWNVGTVTTVTTVSTVTAVTALTGGSTAHDGAAAAINPVLVGAYASQAAPSDVSADADAVRVWALRNGSIVTNLAAGGTLITATSTSLNVNVTNASLTVTDGAGALNVICDSGCTGGTAIAHSAALTIGTTTGAPAMFRASAAAPSTTAVVDDDAVHPWALLTGAAVTQPSYAGVLALAGNGASGTGVQRVTIANDSTGILAAVTTVTTVSTVTTLSQLGGVALPVEDAPETAAGVGIYAMTVRRDTAASSAGATGDNATLNTDDLGRTWTRGGDPCQDHARVTTVAIDTTTSGNVELVALTSTNVIYVCGYEMVSTAAQAFQWIYGTGTACATGETDISGPMAFAANGGIAKANAGAVQFKTAASNALCIETSGTGQVSGYVTYVKTAAP